MPAPTDALRLALPFAAALALSLGAGSAGAASSPGGTTPLCVKTTAGTCATTGFVGSAGYGDDEGEDDGCGGPIGVDKSRPLLGGTKAGAAVNAAPAAGGCGGEDGGGACGGKIRVNTGAPLLGGSIAPRSAGTTASSLRIRTSGKITGTARGCSFPHGGRGRPLVGQPAGGAFGDD